MHRLKASTIWIPVALLLAHFLTRLVGLDLLPLHNDEGLHLTRAVEVWHLHPFWAISDGKFINHWPIALLYPQNAPVFVSRLPTILVTMLGLAAGLNLARRLASQQAALLTGMLWISTPYLFFYERISQSDVEAGALVVVALWAALNTAHAGRMRGAVLTGAAIASAVLFKLSAAPYALAVVIALWFWQKRPWPETARHIVISGVSGAALFAVPLIYLALKGRNLDVALGWVTGNQRDLLAQFGTNLGAFWSHATHFGIPIWLVAVVLGLVGLLAERRHLVLLAATVLPAALILLIAREMEPRHSAVMLPLLVVGAAVGGHNLLARAPAQRWLTALAALLLAASFIPFALLAYQDPAQLPLPARVREQFITTHSAGYGLREAVFALAETVNPPDAPIIGSMFPDSCKRANFYSTEGYRLTCVQAPGLPEIEAVLAGGQSVVYVLREGSGIGFDEAVMQQLGQTTLIAAYPRPGETEANASVTLWRLAAGE